MPKPDRIDRKDTIEFIRDIISSYLPGGDCEVFIFGSRASGRARKWSDIDVGIAGKQRVPLSALGLINEALEKSHLPFKVDVVDFSRVPEDFKTEALKEAVKL